MKMDSRVRGNDGVDARPHHCDPVVANRPWTNSTQSLTLLTDNYPGAGIVVISAIQASCVLRIPRALRLVQRIAQ